MSEREELEQAISALEAQRATLGDVVVDASLSALREKLAALDTAARPEQQRKQVTILFMDIVGSTSIVRELDPEDSLAIMEAALRRLAEPVVEHGGRVTRFMGDGFVALFGHPAASEHDPDNAVRAGLDILAEAQAYANEIAAAWDISSFQVRVGVDTGLVIIGGESEGENTLAGAAVNLAARLENAALPGTLLISQHTYQHVRGVFDLQPLEPIEAKGFAEPVPVYQVFRAKARSFRTRRRGVEGVETRLIGRQGELKALQDAYDLVLSDGERQMVTIAGEAGLGKSRLLYEFENWVDLQPVTVTLFRGRARQETERQPYSLFRDLFAFRFSLQDDHPADAVSDKFVAGFQEVMAGLPGDGEAHERIEMQAHFTGHMLGFGFNASPYIEPLRDDPQQLRDRALIYLVDYFKAAAASAPILLLLEDLHWADDSSLDLLNRLALALRERAALVVSAGRPQLYQRRPHWMEGQPFHLRLDLRPLSRSDSRLLTREVLQRIVNLPDALRDLIVANAEGNPFFVEELVKMLIGEGVIVKGEPAWRVVPDRLAVIRVPATLTGVLQARIDGLVEEERTALQRASVVGRVFWEQSVAYLNHAGELPLTAEMVAEGLHTLREKEMVFRREISTFAGTQEFIFKHALLRDVAYESVLKRVRETYHALAAEWLIQQSGDRVGEMSGVIADHLEYAGNESEALAYLRRAGEDAAERYAHEEAAAYFGRALAHAQESELLTRYQLLLAQERAYDQLGKRDPQRQVLAALEGVTAQMDDEGRQGTVAMRRAWYYYSIDDYDGAVEAAQRAAILAEKAGDFVVGSHAHNVWGRVLREQGRHQEAIARCDTALALARKAGDPTVEGLAFRNLGSVHHDLGNFDLAREQFEQAAELARQAGSIRNESRALNNLAVLASGRGEYDLARNYFQKNIAMARTIGDRLIESVAQGNLGWIDAILGRHVDAGRNLTKALAIGREIGQRQTEAYALMSFAIVAVNSADDERARIHAEEALDIFRATGERTGEANALNRLAQACLGLGDAAAAADAYREALAIHRELEEPHLAMEPLAGLAQAALVAGDESVALLRVEEVLSYLDGGGTLDGIEEPLRVYWACYQVLRAVEDPRALQLLSTAYQRLQELAAKLTDENTRRSFLENVPWHREIVAAAESHGL